MAETINAVARSTTGAATKTFDVSPNASGPTRIVAEKGVRYEFQDLSAKNNGPANLRTKRNYKLPSRLAT